MMQSRRIDYSAAVFIALGLFVIVKSHGLTLGEFTNPGPGLYPLLLGVLLAGASLVSFFTSGRTVSSKAADGGRRKRSVVYMVATLVLFRILLPIAGYCLSAFLMLVLLLRAIGGRPWPRAVAWAIIFTALSFLLFAKGFGVRFPQGRILPF